jgi:hypothetical protein
MKDLPPAATIKGYVRKAMKRIEERQARKPAKR